MVSPVQCSHKRIALSCFVGVLCALGAFAFATQAQPVPDQVAPKTLQRAEQGQRVQPVRVAAIDPDLRRIGPWHELETGITNFPPGCAQYLAFDCYEPHGSDPGYATDGRYGEDCGMESQRWFFGEAYCNTYAINDMQLAPGFEGYESDRLQFAWSWYVDGPGTFEHCYIAVFTAEDFDSSCNGPPSSNRYTGVIYDFGVLDSSSFYYWTDVSLCDHGLSHQLPVDGSGAYEILIANDYDGQNLYAATCAQPMLWGTKSNNPSSQGAVQWDDDNPRDGVHTAPDECYDYALGDCPDPLGAMMCFYSYPDGTPPGCLDLYVGPIQTGGQTQIIVSDARAETRVAVLYSLQRGTWQIQDFNGWCITFDLKLSGNPTRNIVVQGVTDTTGYLWVTIPIPRIQLDGIPIFFQAAEQGTCPDECTSEVEEKEIENENDCDPLPCDPPPLNEETVVSGEPDESTEHYPIEAEDCEGAGDAIFDAENGAGQILDGARRAGWVDGLFGYSYDGSPWHAEKECPNGKWVSRVRLRSIEATLKITTHLPKWDGDDEAWTTFMTNLQTHEDGHVNINKDQFAAYKNALKAAGEAIGCGENAEAAYNDAFDKIEAALEAAHEAEIRRIQALNDAYDKETNHGATQGAVLDCGG